MLNFYNEFLDRYDISEEVKLYLRKSAEVLKEDHLESLSELLCEYIGADHDINAIAEKKASLSEASRIHTYTLSFILIVMAAEKTRERYAELGYGEELFFASAEDIVYKVRECTEVKGVPGIFAESWLKGILDADIFKLGRFEYVARPYGGDTPYVKNGITVNPGDTVITVHIPSCGPFPRELREDSYKRAYEFYKKHFPEYLKGESLVFTCNSWLLYPKLKEILPPHLNMVDFLSDFDIIGERIDPEYRNCWRLFGVEYDGNPDQLPTNTTARRCIATYLGSGKNMGSGFGVRIFTP